MTTLLGIVEAANTGLMVWDVAGPLVQHFMEMGKGSLDVITDDDLAAASLQLGLDIDELHQAIAEKKLRDSGTKT